MVNFCYQRRRGVPALETEVEDMTWLPIMAFTVVAVIYAIGDYVAAKTRGVISSILVAIILLLILGGTLQLLPADLMDLSGLNGMIPTFGMGLILVLCCGAELFTGNSLMASNLAARRISLPALVRNWVIVWFGNLLGALILVALIAMAGTMGLNDGLVGETAVSTAISKVTLDPLTLFARGVLCNVLVCLAVRIGYSSRSTADKVLGILLPISGFVAMGFEHCVANMFFLPIGLVAKAMGYGAGLDGIADLTVQASLYNIGVATLGNIVGGAVVVALAYWYVNNHKPSKRRKSIEER